MAILIRKASSTEEINDVLKLRYQVMKEAGRKPHSIFEISQKITDHFDVFPSTHHFIVYQDGRAVATLRAVEYTENRPFLNQVFDLSETYRQLNNLCYMIDMLAISKELVNHPTLLPELVHTLLLYLARGTFYYVFFLCPQPVLARIQELGFSPIAAPFYSPILQSTIVPLKVALPTFYEQFVEKIADKEIIRFQDVFYKIIFDPGEPLIIQGESGGTAYLIGSGEVEILIEGESDLMSVSTLGPGNLVGEMAMVTGEKRTATIMARTITSCIAFDRSDFLEVLYQHPQRMLDLFKIFSKRITKSNQKLLEKS